MSAFGKKGVRCDWCGKFSSHPNGEYLRPVRNEHGDRLVGYITVRTIGGEDLGHDICRECDAHLCPFCASDQIVMVTPPIPGPDGWGGRCKACGQRWSISTTPVPLRETIPAAGER